MEFASQGPLYCTPNLQKSLARFQLKQQQFSGNFEPFQLTVEVNLQEKKVLEMALFDLPGLLFFSTYTLIVLFWAEIYHQARSLPSDKLRPAYLFINGAVYTLQICIWAYVEIDQKPVAIEVAKLFFAVVSLFAATGFLIYGGRI